MRVEIVAAITALNSVAILFLSYAYLLHSRSRHD